MQEEYDVQQWLQSLRIGMKVQLNWGGNVFVEEVLRSDEEIVFAGDFVFNRTTGKARGDFWFNRPFITPVPA